MTYMVSTRRKDVPWLGELILCIEECRNRGHKPNLVCLGRKQREELVESKRSIPPDEITASDFEWPTCIFGLKMVWTTDEDCVTVYEERPYGWC